MEPESDSKGLGVLKLQEYWGERSSKQKMILVGAFLATFLAVASFAWIANRPSMALLYSGLDPRESGSVLDSLDKSGAIYEIRGDSIWVDQTRRDELRMMLAGKGLPANSGAGYEILDGMSGFGTTSQMFDAAYWRAKEGELARTILAAPNIQSARVHLAVPTGRGYRREAQSSASVTISTNGTPINLAQAKALQFLVSSGVPGMSAEQVTVIDSERGMVNSSEDNTGQDRQAEMKRNVERILEPHVGFGNAIVELNLDLVTQSEIMTEQRFDPQERALISQESEESSDQSTNAQSSAVTAASNLPEGQDSGGDQSRASRSETRQRSNFEVSKVTREVTMQPGAIRRLTVAVLVNGVVQNDGNGTPQLTPRGESELAVIRELVASSVGFDEARGDAITVKSLPFASLSEAGTEAQSAGILARLELNSLARLAIIGLFALAIAIFILRPILRGRSGPTASASAASLDQSAPASILPELAMATEPNLPPFSIAEPEFDFAPMTSMPDDPTARLRELMKARKEDSMQLLSGWIEKRQDPA